MDTEDLIKALAADTRRSRLSLPATWWAAAGLAAIVAAGVFMLTLGPRPDFAAAAETPRFLLKFVVAAALAAAAFGTVRSLSRPGADWRPAAACLAAVAALLVTAVIAELAAVPRGLWAARLIGTNSLVCLTYIPLIGLGPLAVFLTALRHGAPTRPRLAGTMAGLLAGGLAAIFYAAHCPDDSPLFVATWYTMAIAGLAALGALAARHLARW